MNGVCSNVIHLTKCRLEFYGGNYDAFTRTKMELEENQAKRYQWEQDQIAHMKVSFYLKPLSQEWVNTPVDFPVRAVQKLPRKVIYPAWVSDEQMRKDKNMKIFPSTGVIQ